jgi:hypothetical protein
MTVNVEAIRAEALFVSPLQSSDRPAPDDVLRAVATTLRRFGMRGCALRVAGEFGEHPEAAADRMAWALSMIRVAYPTQPKPTLPKPAAQQPLALAG